MPVCIISLQIQHALASVKLLCENQSAGILFSLFLFFFISPVKRTLQYIQVNLKANLNESNHTNAKPINSVSDIYARSQLSDLGSWSCSYTESPYVRIYKFSGLRIFGHCITILIKRC